jgi:hypothetical protein
MSIFLAFILLGYVVVLSIKKKLDLLNPSTIFSLLILSTYFISSLRLSLLQNEYPIWFTLLIICMIVAFYLGNQTSRLMKFSKHVKMISYSPTTMRIVVFGIWIAIVFSFFVMIYKLGAPPAISKVERADYFISGWGTIVILQSSLFGLLLYDHYNSKSVGALFWWYFSTITIIAFLMSNKFQIIYMMVLFLVAYNTYKRRINIHTLLKVAVLIVILFIFLYELVYKQMYGVSLSDMYNGYQIILPDNLKFLTQPYLYVAFNYENLFQFFLYDTHNLLGLKTFGAILDIFHVRHLYPENISMYVDEWKNLLRIKSMTTGTMFQDFAQDGGVIWMFIFTYLSGVWSGISYRLFKVNQNFGTFFMYSATTVAIFMSFFSNAFTSKVTIINLLMSFLISQILRLDIIFRRK